MSPQVDLGGIHRASLLRLIRSHLPNTEVWAYGSRVRGTSRPSSDLDLAVFTEPAQRRQVAELREALDESDLPFRVDVLVWDDLPQSFRAEIQRQRVVLTSSRTTRPGSGRSTR